MDNEQEWASSRTQIIKELDLSAYSTWKSQLWIHIIGLSLVISLTQYFFEALTIPLVISWLGVAINLRLILIGFTIQKVQAITNSHLAESGELGRSTRK